LCASFYDLLVHRYTGSTSDRCANRCSDGPAEHRTNYASDGGAKACRHSSATVLFGQLLEGIPCNILEFIRLHVFELLHQMRHCETW